ncbi:MAG TPA: exodeoxyribonuclease III, partial [Casimicrobium sp.]|nr:exodeoxyribonuclease III [Casimicrobium sp.]
MKIVTLNANGIRSAHNKGLASWMAGLRGWDVFCLQEMKAQESDIPEEMLRPKKSHGHFFPAERKGYSGTAVWTKQKPLNVQRGFGVTEFDGEGRYLEVDLGPLVVVSLYLPSGAAGPERQASKDRFLSEFPKHLQALRKLGKEIVICGDFNIAHKEIDLKNYKSNKKNSGFLPHEREWLTHVF